MSLKLINIKLNGLEELLEKVVSNKKFIEKQFRRYEGNFFVRGDRLVPIPKLPFFNYDSTELDVNDPDVFLAVVYDDPFNKPPVHFENGSLIKVFRPNKKGKLHPGNYNIYSDVH